MGSTGGMEDVLGRRFRKSQRILPWKCKRFDACKSATKLINVSSPLPSPIIVLVVSMEKRLFVAHEDVLSRSPYFRPILRDLAIEDQEDKVVELLDELVLL